MLFIIDLFMYSSMPEQVKIYGGFPFAMLMIIVALFSAYKIYEIAKILPTGIPIYKKGDKIRVLLSGNTFEPDKPSHLLWFSALFERVEDDKFVLKVKVDKQDFSKIEIVTVKPEQTLSVKEWKDYHQALHRARTAIRENPEYYQNQ